MSSAVIWVRFTEPGMHHWPHAPESRAYLAQPHRHLFHVRVSTPVTHDDRELEFHDLQDAARSIFRHVVGDGTAPTPDDKGALSCEAMARQLAQSLAAQYGREFGVEVSEDGECGALVIES